MPSSMKVVAIIGILQFSILLHTLVAPLRMYPKKPCSSSPRPFVTSTGTTHLKLITLIYHLSCNLLLFMAFSNIFNLWHTLLPSNPPCYSSLRSYTHVKILSYIYYKVSWSNHHFYFNISCFQVGHINNLFGWHFIAHPSWPPKQCISELKSICQIFSIPTTTHFPI